MVHILIQDFSDHKTLFKVFYFAKQIYTVQKIFSKKFFTQNSIMMKIHCAQRNQLTFIEVISYATLRKVLDRPTF